MRPLAALLLATAAATSAQEQIPRPTDEAERLSLIGDLPGARSSAEHILARDPADGPALLLAACVALRQGDLAAADGYARRLARLDPVPAEAPVLTALVARRRVKPAEPIHEALGAAWREAGSPEPKRQLLRDTMARALDGGAIFGIDRKALAKLPPGEAWLVEEATGGAGPIFAEGARVKELERSAGKNGFLVNLVLLGRPTRQDVSGLLRALAAARPDDGAIALAIALQGGPGPSAPYSPAELAKLEAAANAPRFGLSAAEWRQLEEGFAAQAATAVKRGHRWLARMAAVNGAIGLSIPCTLARDRADATTGPARERAARALLRMGRRFGESPLRLDQGMGILLESWATTALEDGPAIAAAQEKRLRWAAESDAQLWALGSWSWPLSSLDDDLGPLR